MLCLPDRLKVIGFRFETDRMGSKRVVFAVGVLEIVDQFVQQSGTVDGALNRVSALRAKLTDAEGRLGRLYQAIENGIADPADPTLKARLAAVKQERDVAQVTFDRAVAEMSPDAQITEAKIAAFVATMRENVLTGDTGFRRAWLRAVIDTVEVDDTEIRIHGRSSVLERLMMAARRFLHQCPVLFGIGGWRGPKVQPSPPTETADGSWKHNGRERLPIQSRKSSLNLSI